jgi:hypothetical protein
VGGPGAGNIKCNIVAGTNPPIGTCSNPTSCDPEGDVCGGTGGGKVNAREDCCDCAPPKFNCCKPDGNGVYRCYGTPGGNPGACPNGYTGTAPCCIAAGAQCTFSSECCGGTPCLPDGNGVLRCQAPTPDGGPTCVNLNGVCTSSGDCCAGGACTLVIGQLTGTCTPVAPPPPPPPPADAGVVCKGTGDTCASVADCCQGLMCLKPTGATLGACGTVPPPPADAGTPDATTPPDAPVCALAGGSCMSALDCCSGLFCYLAEGASVGVCGAPPPPPPPPPPACATTGQACLTSTDCCAPNTCFAPGGTNVVCTGQAGCTCYYVIP